MGATKETKTLASLPVDSECEIIDITTDGSNYYVTGYYTTDENEFESELIITENQVEEYLSEFYNIVKFNTNTKKGKYLLMTDGEQDTFIPFDQYIDENKYELFDNLIKEKSGKL
jgi:hypothetical protein